MQKSAGALLRLDSPLRNGCFGKAVADREELLVRLRSMLLGLRFHLSEGGGPCILLGMLRLLALGNADLLLLQGGLHDLRLFRSGFFAACIEFIRLHHRADKLTLFRLERQMRCLLILGLQRRVELLLLCCLRILMDLAGVYGMLRFVKRLLGVFSLFRVYRRGKNRSADSGQAGWCSAAAARKQTRTGNGCRCWRVSG